MKAWQGNIIEVCAVSRIWTAAPPPGLRPSYLYLVNPHDLQRLRDQLAEGRVPKDFEAKLCRLAAGDLGSRFIAQHSRTFIALLTATLNGTFSKASREEYERLLQVLAYVREDEDAIPDYRLDGFTDDREEVRAAVTELNPLLQSFKAWRLRHQVPGMWS